MPDESSMPSLERGDIISFLPTSEWGGNGISNQHMRELADNGETVVCIGDDHLWFTTSAYTWQKSWIASITRNGVLIWGRKQRRKLCPCLLDRLRKAEESVLQ